MRVNISYTCELEEVPGKVAEMIEQSNKSIHQDISKQLNEITGLLQFPEGVSRIVLAIEQVSKVRRSLESVAEALTDCDSILKGYVQAVQQLAAAEVTQNLAVTTPSVNEIVSEIENTEKTYVEREQEVED